tara:strand:- start:41 stop:1015 length:975 start_codon:yes stop_codon:yes gene_type:complete
MTEEEKRRRYSRGVQLTPELKEWVIRATNAQRTGQAIPPPPTRMTGIRVPGDADYVTPIGNEQPRANQGQPEFAPAYVDPRSEAIAQTPALVRPVHGMMDKLFRPGRADVVNEMNRKYLEDLPERQAAQQKRRSEGLIEELRARALGGDAAADAALLRLQKFREADRPSTSRGSGSSGEAWRQLAGEGGEAGRDARGSARPNTDDPLPTTEPALTGVEGHLTTEENVGSIKNKIDANEREVAELEQSLSSGEKKVRGAKQSPRDFFFHPEEGDTVKMDWDSSEAARQRIIALQNENVELAKSLKDPRLNRPAADAGGPTVAPRQ